MDAGQQVRCCLIAFAFATGYVPRGEDDWIAGAVRGVLLRSGLPGGFGGMFVASLGSALFGALFQCGILRTAADGQEDRQSDELDRDWCDSPNSARGYPQCGCRGSWCLASLTTFMAAS